MVVNVLRSMTGSWASIAGVVVTVVVLGVVVVVSNDIKEVDAAVSS